MSTSSSHPQDSLPVIFHTASLRRAKTSAAMESTSGDRTTGEVANQEADHKLLMSSKPLHRFGLREPKSLGIVFLVLGCAEVMMGFVLSQVQTRVISTFLYIPFWEGALFLICGNLSIYTEIHPSKKMVTVSLAMYAVALLGCVVSFGTRIHILSYFSYMRPSDTWGSYKYVMLAGIEGILFASSLCVLVMLIFLIIVARFALKSTRSQVIVQCIPPPPSVTQSG